MRNKGLEIETKPLTIELDNLSIEEIKEMFKQELAFYEKNRPKFV